LRDLQIIKYWLHLRKQNISFSRYNDRVKPELPDSKR
jgi:hypothetical protein